MNRKDARAPRGRRTLIVQYVVLMTCIASGLVVAYSAWSYGEQTRQI